MSKFTMFSISTPSRHPAKLEGYDAVKHRYRPDYVNPPSWDLELTPFPAAPFSFGTIVKIPDEIESLEWTVKQVNGTFAIHVPRSKPGPLESALKKTVQVPVPGKYEVTLQANLKDGSTETNTRIFKLRDFLIVGIGDSFAAGQGNPDVPAVPSPDQKAFCKATTLAAFVINQRAELEQFFKKLAEKGDKFLKEGILLVPLLGKVVVAGLNQAQDILSTVKGGISDLRGWAVDVARKGESLVVEGAEEVAGWFDFGDGGEFNESKPRAASWQEPLAYRSYRSGQSLAAAEIESLSFRGADRVTFLSFARTGSEIVDGLLGPRTVAADLLGKDVGLGRISLDTWTQDRGQIQEAKDTLAGRRPDALIVSVGVNDVGFASHVEDSILKKSGGDRKKRIEATEKYIETDFPAHLDLLKRTIDTELRPRKVFITEYPVGIFKEVAEHGPCGILESFLGKDLNVSKPEARDMNMLGILLNKAIRRKADEFGWVLVEGIAREFDGHGYCAKRSYFVFAEDSSPQPRRFRGSVAPQQARPRNHARSDCIRIKARVDCST